MANRGTFSVGTLNVRGMGSAHKIGLVYEATKDLQIVCLQETYFFSAADVADFEAIFSRTFEIRYSYATPNDSKAGIALLVNRNFIGSIGGEVLNLPGRALSFVYCVESYNFLLTCLYVPTLPDKRVEFFDLLLERLSQTEWYNCNSMFFAGDFNLVEDPQLDRSGNARDPQIGLEQLLTFKEDFGLVDSYRYKKPGERIYTFFSNRHGTQSRIDRIYCSTNVADYWTSSRTRTVRNSDHSVMICRFSVKFLSIKYGPSYYKMNTLLLNETVAQNYIEQKLSNFTFRTDNIILEWEELKYQLKFFLQNFQRTKAFERKRERRSLELRMAEVRRSLQTNPTDHENKRSLKNMQNQLEVLNTYYVRQCLHNSHYKDIVNDRVSLSTAKSIQKRSAESRYFYALTARNGQTLTDSKHILNEVHEQYVTLFTSEGCNREEGERFLNHDGLKSLSPVEAEDLEGNITGEEIRRAILSFDKGKTPGSDGLSIDLYVNYIHYFVPILQMLFRNCFARHELSPSMQLGIISQLFKKGDRTKRENWRPLSMLNVDYKILTKVLTLRLKTVATKLVHSDQTCAVPGREIKDGIFNLYNIIECSNMYNDDMLLVSVDHKQAFDMVEWDFMKLTLEKLGLGHNLRKWVDIIYSHGHVLSSVMVNGFISPSFTPSRGIRQGCPLSAILYVLSTEPLANFLRNSNRISGVSFFGKTYRITKYADDTTIFAKNYNEVREVFSIFDHFQAASGSRITHTKTQILRLGSFRNQDPPLLYQHFVVEEMKIYGVHISATLGMDCNRNWNKAWEQVAKLRRSVPPKCLSIYGKIHTIMTFYLSAFWYTCCFVNPSMDLIKETEKQMDSYVWYPSRRNFVKKKVVKLPKDRGGLNYPDIESRVWAMRLMLLVKRWKDKESQTWHHSFDILYGRVRDKSLQQLGAVTAPKLYKDLRKIQLQTRFRKISRTQFLCCGKTYFIENVKSRDIYRAIILQKFGAATIASHTVWGNWLGCDENVLSQSWQYSRANFEDGYTRTFHYSLIHRTLLTRDRTHHFMDNVPDFCSYCFTTEGDVVREDLNHVFLFCSRAYNMYADIDPLLKRISEKQNLSLQDLILGIFLPNDKRRQNCFNLIIHTAHRAIWMSKKSYDRNEDDFDIMQYFKRILYFDVAKARILWPWQKFENYFGGENGLIMPVNSAIGFSLINW